MTYPIEVQLALHALGLDAVKLGEGGGSTGSSQQRVAAAMIVVVLRGAGIARVVPVVRVSFVEALQASQSVSLRGTVEEKTYRGQLRPGWTRDGDALTAAC